jgi:hypothetical protein
VLCQISALLTCGLPWLQRVTGNEVRKKLPYPHRFAVLQINLPTYMYRALFPRGCLRNGYHIQARQQAQKSRRPTLIVQNKYICTKAFIKLLIRVRFVWKPDACEEGDKIAMKVYVAAVVARRSRLSHVEVLSADGKFGRKMNIFGSESKDTYFVAIGHHFISLSLHIVFLTLRRCYEISKRSLNFPRCGIIVGESAATFESFSGLRYQNKSHNSNG